MGNGHDRSARSRRRHSVDLPESRRYWLKKRLSGCRRSILIVSEDERSGKPTALAVCASDNLSSSAYASEEILRVLVLVHRSRCVSLLVPITVALLVVLGFLILSYRETIKAYPTAGGAYMVTQAYPWLLPAPGSAGVALLTDYAAHGGSVGRSGKLRPWLRHSPDSRRTTS